MKLLVDMNLTPEWVPFFAAAGIDAVHWSNIGAGGAADSTLMTWAREERRVVFTNDLDFGTLLALAGTTGPSVVQVRTLDLVPTAIGDDVLRLLRDHASSLSAGAIVTLDNSRTRVRILPIGRPPAPTD